MIVNILILVLGVALAVAAVLLRKKLGTAWTASLLCGAVLVCAVGGVFTWAARQDALEEKQQVYLALQYLEYHEIDNASFHLKKNDGDTFAAAGAGALLETMRGNRILVQMKLDAMDGLAESNEQKGIAARLKNLTADDYEGQQSAAQLLRGQIGLSEKQQKEADKRFAAESGRYMEGMDGETVQPDETEQLRSQINSQVGYGSYAGAVRSAVRLVDLSPTAENRLLLAETIAEAVHNGEYLTGDQFIVVSAENPLSDEEAKTPNAEKERAKLQEKIDKLTLEAENLQLLIDGASDEEEKLAYIAEQSELLDQIKQLEKNQMYLFAQRALSSIADLHSLQAAVVRARLHYAMTDYEGAMECLLDATSSPAAWTTTDGNLRNAFRILLKAENEAGTAGTQSVEFRDTITTLLSGGGSDLIAIANGNLSRSFADYIVSAQKTYGKNLYSIGVDTSNYPEIVVYLSGRDTVLDKLVHETDVIVRDTHREVSYAAVVPESENTFVNICCVVDESGSMNGEPTQNLCAALSSFINALGDNTSIGIVGFENGYTVHAPMSENHAAAAAAVSGIHASGGTNITAGITGAMETMKDCIGKKTVLLMTDGQSNIDMNVVQSAADAGYAIHTIGFGGVNDELLQQIADATGGQYIKAETSTELVNIYLSLVGMIGNEVEIRYTVIDQGMEEMDRYFFVRIPGEAASLRVEYVVQQDERILPELHQAIPSLITETEANGGRNLTFNLYGEHLRNVSEVTVGGKTATIQKSDSDTYVTVQVPSGLSSGWQEIVLTEADGTKSAFDRMICVAEELNVRAFRLQNLMIRGRQAALTKDGLLVLGDYVTISDEWANEVTLSLNVDGLLAIPVDKQALLAQIPGGIEELVVVPETPETEEDPESSDLPALPAAPEIVYPEYPELTLTGDPEGAGYVRLNWNDSGYANDTDNLVAQGPFSMEYDNDQLRLIQD